MLRTKRDLFDHLRRTVTGVGPTLSGPLAQARLEIPNVLQVAADFEPLKIEEGDLLYLYGISLTPTYWHVECRWHPAELSRKGSAPPSRPDPRAAAFIVQTPPNLRVGQRVRLTYRYTNVLGIEQNRILTVTGRFIRPQELREFNSWTPPEWLPYKAEAPVKLKGRKSRPRTLEEDLKRLHRENVQLQARRARRQAERDAQHE